MPKYSVPCTWTRYGEYIVEADSLEEAIAKAKEIPALPTESQYLDDSLQFHEKDASELEED